MKKTLLALAAIAASSAAFAQSSVTLYGVVDASVENVKGTSGSDKTATRVSSDNLATSRVGLKGSEDLGGGLKTNFNLETNVKVDTGAQGNTRFFDRAAWVGLAGGFGEVRLGRIDSSIGLLAGNSAILGAQAYDDFKIAKTFSGDTYRRVDNAVTYLLPKFVDGLTAQVQYSAAAGTSSTTGTEVGGTKAGRNVGLNVQYVAGAFGAGLGYINAYNTDPVGAVRADKDKGVLAYASYDFGLAKLTAYGEQDTRDSADKSRQLYGARVDVPVTQAFAVQASLSRVKNQTLSATDTIDDNATIVALKGVYALSKRTSVYGLYTAVNNGDGMKKTIGGDDMFTNGKNAHGLAFGLVHKF